MEEARAVDKILFNTNLNSFVACSDSIKVEDIKEELNVGESNHADPLSILDNIATDDSENIVKEEKELIDDDSEYFEEKHNPGDKENNTVIDDTDIIEHKIETDI